MGNCLTLPPSAKNLSKKSNALPMETIFKLPSSLPVWPPGDGFASGVIDLGGLQICQISSFNPVWATKQGGPDDLGASFFEPSPIPQGFHMLGCFSQPNNEAFYGCVLVGKDGLSSIDGGALKEPLDYTLVWSSESLIIKQDTPGYIWLPTAPDGYEALGHVVTISPEKPSLDKIRCVRSDFTEHCTTDAWIWGQSKTKDANGFNVHKVIPSNRGRQAQGVCVGTFVAQNNWTSSSLSISCLKNKEANLSAMPNPEQIDALIQAYSPIVYLHPNEQYLPSSVNWYFSRGALLYKKGEESKPVPIQQNGSNLPQGGFDDGEYWIDLPVDKANKERVKKGDLQSCQAYMHIKPMLGATFTDIAVWMFYPFNGPARAKVEFLNNIGLGKVGEHVGDWEHVTLRISNLNGELRRVYFSQHSGGVWVDSPELEFQKDNKPVAYSSLNGHAFYPRPGLVLQGSGNIGIRNETKKSVKVMDTGVRFEVVAAEHLGSAIVEPPWLNYFRKWGPKIEYDTADEFKKVEKLLPGKLKSAFIKFVSSLPNEIYREDGPTGPKLKNNWEADERA